MLLCWSEERKKVKCGCVSVCLFVRNGEESDVRKWKVMGTVGMCTLSAKGKGERCEEGKGGTKRDERNER